MKYECQCHVQTRRPKAMSGRTDEGGGRTWVKSQKKGPEPKPSFASKLAIGPTRERITVLKASARRTESAFGKRLGGHQRSDQT